MSRAIRNASASDPLNLPILLNAMALWMGGAEASFRHRDAGTRALLAWAKERVDPRSGLALRRWVSGLKRTDLFRQSARIAEAFATSRRPGGESAFLLALLEQVSSLCASLAGRAVGRRAAHRVAAPRRRIIETIHAAARDCRRTYRPHQGDLQRIVAAAIKRFHFREGSILAFDEARGDLVFFLSVSPVAEKLAGLRVPLEGSIAGSLLRTRQPAYVADVLRSGQHYGEVDRKTGVTTTSILGAPLLSRERPLGVIELVNRTTAAPCRQKDIEAFMPYADAARVLLGDARRRQILVECFARGLKICLRGKGGGGLAGLARACRGWRLPEDAASAWQAALAILQIAASGPAAANAALQMLHRFQQFAHGRRPAAMRFGRIGFADGQEK